MKTSRRLIELELARIIPNEMHEILVKYRLYSKWLRRASSCLFILLQLPDCKRKCKFHIGSWKGKDFIEYPPTFWFQLMFNLRSGYLHQPSMRKSKEMMAFLELNTLETIIRNGHKTTIIRNDMMLMFNLKNIELL